MPWEVGLVLFFDPLGSVLKTRKISRTSNDENAVFMPRRDGNGRWRQQITYLTRTRWVKACYGSLDDLDIDLEV